MKSLLILALTAALASAQSTGDYILQRKTSTGYAAKSVTPENGKMLGWNSSGDPVAIAPVTSLSWDAISGKPSTFAPATHQHTAADITDPENITHPAQSLLPRTNARILSWTSSSPTASGYPWLEPLRVLVFGDSLIENQPAAGLENVFGSAGAGSTTWVPQGFAGGAAYSTSEYTYWPTGRVTTLPSGGSAIWAIGGVGQTEGFRATRICVGYIKEPGAGNLVVEYSEDNGATWKAALATLSASNATTIGAWYETALPTWSELIKIRLSATGGTVRVVNAGGWVSGGGGVVGSNLLARGGENLVGNMDTCPSAIYAPIIGGYNPDLIVQCFHDWEVEAYDPGAQADVFASAILGATRYTSPLSAITISPAGANNDLTFTARGEDASGYPPSIGYINPGTPNASLSLSVANGYIQINLATNGSSAITTTAAQIKAAIEGNASANALVAVSYPASNDGSGVVTAMAEATVFAIPSDWVVMAKNPEYHRTDETIKTVDFPLLKAFASRNKLQFWDGFSIFGSHKQAMAAGLVSAQGIGDPHPTARGYLYRSQRFAEDVIASCVGKSGNIFNVANFGGLKFYPEELNISDKGWVFGGDATTSNTVRFGTSLIANGAVYARASANKTWSKRAGIKYDSSTDEGVMENLGGTRWVPSVDGHILGSNTKRWEIFGLSYSAYYRETSADITTQTYDHTINVTANSVTVNLRTASGHNRIMVIINSGSGTVTIDPSGTETIGGSSTKTLAAGQRCTIQSNGSNGYVVFNDG